MEAACRGLAELVEGVDHAEEGWAVQELVPARLGSAFVLNAGRLLLTKPEFPVSRKIVPNAGPRW
jgi:hypothetical protein